MAAGTHGARSAGRWLGAFLLLLTGCRETVFEPVRDGLVETAELEGVVRVTTRADLLFVVDDSPSMENEQEKLAAGFPALVAALRALDPPVDWRAGVITTSVGERFGPCDEAEPSAAASCASAFGGGGFSCEQGACVRSWPTAGALVSAPGFPEIIDGSRLDAAAAAQAFAANVRVGTSGARQEQPLRAVRAAIESGQLSTLIRPEARLVVVVASDEDDCSDSRGSLLALEATPGGIVDHCAEESDRDTGLLDDIDDWVDWLSTGREASMGAIVGLAPGTREPGTCVDESCAQRCDDAGGQRRCADACTGALRPTLCERECVEECVAFCGAGVAGRRLSRAVRGLGGVLSSVCDEDFGPGLAQLARVMGIPKEIALPSVPADDRAFFFSVTRAGATIDCAVGRDFTINRQSVPPLLVIDDAGACRLRPDDRWRVRYVASP